MTTAEITAEPSVEEIVEGDQFVQYRGLLSDKLRETKDRKTYNVTEVRDALLDLWLALTADQEGTHDGDAVHSTG